MIEELVVQEAVKICCHKEVEKAHQETLTMKMLAITTPIMLVNNLRAEVEALKWKAKASIVYQ